MVLTPVKGRLKHTTSVSKDERHFGGQVVCGAAGQAD
jgi:hypothetical protein